MTTSSWTSTLVACGTNSSFIFAALLQEFGCRVQIFCTGEEPSDWEILIEDAPIKLVVLNQETGAPSVQRCVEFWHEKLPGVAIIVVVNDNREHNLVEDGFVLIDMNELAGFGDFGTLLTRLSRLICELVPQATGRKSPPTPGTAGSFYIIDNINGILLAHFSRAA